MSDDKPVVDLADIAIQRDPNDPSRLHITIRDPRFTDAETMAMREAFRAAISDVAPALGESKEDYRRRVFEYLTRRP